MDKGGNNLFLVDEKGSRYMDCKQVPLPFGPLSVSDVAHRTHTVQDQVQALYAAELVNKAQMSAKTVSLEAQVDKCEEVANWYGLRL